MTAEKGSLRSGTLVDIRQMPRNEANGWLFDRPTNWAFHRALGTNDQSETQATDTKMAATIWEEAIADKLSTVTTQFPVNKNKSIKVMNWHYTKTKIQ